MSDLHAPTSPPLVAPGGLLARIRPSNPHGAEPTEPVSGWFMFIYFFAQVAAWVGILTPVVVTIALRVSEITTAAERATQLGYVLSVGAFGCMVAAPIAGTLSDRTTSRWGRRRPHIVAGGAFLLLGLTIIAFSPNMWLLGLGWLICQVGSQFNQAAMNAILPDVVPEGQRGRMSGLLGLSATLAMMLGTWVTQYTTGSTIAMFLVPWLLIPIGYGLLLAVFPDTPADRATVGRFRAKDLALSFWINPVRYPDFSFALLSRLLVFVGTAFLTTYQAYFLSDHLNVSTSELASFVFFSTTVTAVITVFISITGGWLSDRLSRRKPFVGVAALIVSAGLVLIGTSDTFNQFIVGAAVTSLGQGLYYSVDIAVAAAVIPKDEGAAKAMGVFQIANSLPQSLAPAIAPLFLAIGGTGQNYQAVFFAGVVFAILGALALLPVRGVK
ncbi:MFS transporter [Kineosporia sp. J2-2]|uniref:MFS transporter n=1 Tax=Kineosporia corallincola TaxID=2835133 RepID=A0ABS5TMN0_9ACTN|nr:MFS transporter [Kineosporia corallincola]MBT0771446.1 MFS transporter [Kineosporia corallincola]